MSPFASHSPQLLLSPRAPFSRVVVLTFLSLLLLAAVWPSRVPAAEETGQEAIADIWLISTRWSRRYDQPDLRVWRKTDGRWIATTTEDFWATNDSALPTVMWIHGDLVDHWQSAGYGMTVYRRLRAHAEGRPFRFVIWSWPSSQMHGTGPLKAARIKAGRADREALSLAWFIDRIDPSAPVSLVGYSFGARIATGALHLLGGGRLVGRRLEERVHPDRHPLRAVLLAAALDNYSLARGQRNGLALSQVDQLLNLYNPCDEVLKWYPLLCGLFSNGPDAAGYTGLVGSFGEHRPKLRQVNVSGYVGDSHDWQDYFYYGGIVARIADVALFPDLAGPPSSDQPQISAPAARRLDLVVPRPKLKR